MIKKILVPLDGSELAEKALPYAEELAQKFKADLTLVWVLQPLVIMSDYNPSSYGKILDTERHEATTYLHTIQQKLDEKHLSAQPTVLSGQSAAESIIDLACQEQTDLIIMSTHGRSGLSRWVYGSVANKVLQHAPCPIYLIKVKEG